MAIYISYWWVLALISGLGLATRNIMFKVGSDHLDPALASLFLSLSMSVVSIVYFIIERLNVNEPFFKDNINNKGILYAIVAGVGVAGANIFLAKSYHSGGQASTVAVIQNGFSISVTLIIGLLALGEVIRPIQALGIIVAFIGIVMIAKG